MHRLTIPDNIIDSVPVLDGQDLEPGESYICSNKFLGHIFSSSWRCTLKNGEVWPIRTQVKATPWYQEPDLESPDIWLFRGGGWGDLLMMTPALIELKKKWPDKKFHVACGDGFHCLFQGPGLDHIIPERIPIKEDNDAHRAIISFEEAIEGDPIGATRHIAQVFARKFGIVLNKTKPTYNITLEERAWANRTYPKSNKKRVGIQFLASGLYRSYPHMAKVMVDLAKDHEVFLFGLPEQVMLKNPIENVINLMAPPHKLTFRESAAILSTCDSCVAPDSSFVHLASALDMPCVALYGPIPAALRISSELTNALEGTAPCAPCFFHAEGSAEFPPGMPCFEKGRCVALEKIPAEAVVNAVNEQLDIHSNIIVMP